MEAENVFFYGGLSSSILAIILLVASIIKEKVLIQSFGILGVGFGIGGVILLFIASIINDKKLMERRE